MNKRQLCDQIIIKYEKGERKLNGKNLTLFANYCGVTTDYIVGITDEKTLTTESDEMEWWRHGSWANYKGW